MQPIPFHVSPSPFDLGERVCVYDFTAWDSAFDMIAKWNYPGELVEFGLKFDFTSPNPTPQVIRKSKQIDE